MEKIVKEDFIDEYYSEQEEEFEDEVNVESSEETDTV